MVDDPSGFWITSGGSLDCTISDVVAGGAQDFFGGLLDPSDEVPADGATLEPCFRYPTFIEDSAKRWTPGLVKYVAGKARQEW